MLNFVLVWREATQCLVSDTSKERTAFIFTQFRWLLFDEFLKTRFLSVSAAVEMFASKGSFDPWFKHSREAFLAVANAVLSRESQTTLLRHQRNWSSSTLCLNYCKMMLFISAFWLTSVFVRGSFFLLWRPRGFGDFRKKKTPKRTWLCAGISPVRYALQTR